MPSQRKLPDKVEQEAQGILGLKVNKKLLQNYLHNVSGKVITLRTLLQVFAIELVTFAVDFIPLAVEFGAFAVEFIVLALQFCTALLFS